VRSLSFVVCAVLLCGAADASGKPGKSGARGLKKVQCEAVCQQLLGCEGMSLADSSTLAESLICVDDCVAESKLAKKRAGWFCAADAKSCDALRACEPGGPGRTEAGRVHSG
jgi:hypothetical protein